MYEEMKNIEDIDTITIYKMIQALFRYDYFSTKCFVNELLKKRKEKQEIEHLKVIQELLFYQDSIQIEQVLTKLIDEDKKEKRRKKCKGNV